MTFPYNTTLPNPPDDPADDVGGMQVNTLSISELIAIDHVGFNTPSGGYHNQVSFALNQTAPGLGSGVGEIYANTAKANSWPFWQNALGTTFQLAGSSPLPLTNNGYVVASGLYIQWGRVTGLGGAWPLTPQTVSFTPPNTSFNAVGFAVYTSFIGPASTTTGDICIIGTSAGSFVWQFTGGAASQFDGFYWLAIGR